MKNKFLTLLEKLGFTQNESRVYLTLLETKEASPTDISRKAQMLRPLVYKALSPLIEKGLVRITAKGKRTMYSAESPEKLETMFRNLERDFFSDIEDLHDIYNSAQTKPTMTIMEGQNEIKNAYMDMMHSLKKGETYYRYSSIHKFRGQKYVPKGYEAIRDKKGLERYIITSEVGGQHKLKLGRAVKTIPKEFDLFNQEINLLIYQDKVVVIDYPSKTAITIKHGKFAEFQKKLFKLLFSKL